MADSRVVQQVLAVGRRKRVGPKLLKAAAETGLVESGFRNLPGGDADSAGWRQERASLYPNPTNVKASASRFFNEAAKLNRPGISAGELAARVQRPAAQYRGRYQDVASEAEALLRQHAAGYLGQSMPGESTQSVQLGRQQTFDQAGYDEARKRFVLAGMIAKHNPDSVLLKTGLLSTAAPSPQDFAGSRLTSKTVTSTAPALKTTQAKQAGVATFEGKKVAAWIAPLLQYARENGWKGTVTSGYRSDAEQKAIYDRGTRPAAKPISEGGGGSNHSRTGYLQGAVDVSDAATLDRILRRKGSRLKWAGAKDPVHFSVPRGGSY